MMRQNILDGMMLTMLAICMNAVESGGHTQSGSTGNNSTYPEDDMPYYSYNSFGTAKIIGGFIGLVFIFTLVTIMIRRGPKSRWFWNFHRQNHRNIHSSTPSLAIQAVVAVRRQRQATHCSGRRHTETEGTAPMELKSTTLMMKPPPYAELPPSYYDVIFNEHVTETTTDQENSVSNSHISTIT